MAEVRPLHGIQDGHQELIDCPLLVVENQRAVPRVRPPGLKSKLIKDDMRTTSRPGTSINVVIRQGTVEDCKAIDPWDEFSGDRPTDATSGHLYVAELDRTVVGYLVCGAPVFHGQVFISQLCVAPSHRRLGVAVALLSAIANQYVPSEIWTSTEQWNEAAVATFRRIGFERRGAISGMNKDGSDEIYFSRRHAT